MPKTAVDRTGKKYGEFTCIGPSKHPGTWQLKCSCGTLQICSTDNLKRKRSCGCKNRFKNIRRTITLEDYERATGLDNKRHLEPGRYAIEHPMCKHEIIGTLIDQYVLTASFEIERTHPLDRALIRNLNNRVSVEKRKVRFLE